MRMRRYSLEDMTRPPVQPDTNPKRVPVYAADLIQELDEMIPPRCIGAGESLESAHRYAGQRQLVEHLLHRLQSQIPQDPTQSVIPDVHD